MGDACDERKTLIEHSRYLWIGTGTTEHIRTGCLQRIADATEKMAGRHKELMADRDWYEKHWNDCLVIIRKQDRRIAALRGVITKMKKEAKP